MTSHASDFQYLFHLKQGQTRDAKTGGKLYLTLCGHWVFDSIAADADCSDRWVTCPQCAEKDPYPWYRNQRDLPAAFLPRR